jgi:glutaminyl-tRNA synthetase
MTTGSTTVNATSEGARPPDKPTHFIRQQVEKDLAAGQVGTVVTRFPPEPNGYLHIGHAKALYLDFGLAADFRGRCHLRFDDTNPEKEEQRFIDAIKQDIRWLGFDWGEHEYYASDYFELLYDWAAALVEAGKAYVDDQTADEISRTRGSLKAPGTPSPFRDRTPAENLDLFQRMRAGEFPDGSRVLRAKIDMASPNLNLRDPVMYRIKRAPHPRTGTQWCIYPMYDWAHGQNDWMEGITHSLCSLEYEDHRPLYDWFIDTLMEIGVRPEQGVPSIHPDVRPRQTEFARFELTHTLMSKRLLRAMVEEGVVDGWDDPRMPTLCGFRHRGFTPRAILNFCETIGVTKFVATHQLALLEHVLRDDLNKVAGRRMAVMDPLKVVITNYEADGEELDAVNNPEDESAGSRRVPFGREVFIERDDFMEDPPRKFKRLSPGETVRLRWAYFITCDEAVKNDAGEVVELRCTYHPASRGGDSAEGLPKPKGTIHWVSAANALDAEVRLYDVLFTEEEPSSENWKQSLNPHSLKVVHAKVEPTLRDAEPGEPLQFERIGYFTVDSRDSKPQALVFNRTVGLKDSWSKAKGKG